MSGTPTPVPTAAPGTDGTLMPAGLSAAALHGEAARAAAAAQGAEGFATVADALAAAGHPRRPVWLSASARTAQEAADVLGIALGQIAKSIVFRRQADEAVVLVVTSGDRRVDERKVAAVTGPLGRADAAFVKAKTGFSIGGVSPLAHATKAVVLIDRELFRFDEVWAAAGHPHGVFPATPQQLQALTGAPVHDVVQAVAPTPSPGASA